MEKETVQDKFNRKLKGIRSWDDFVALRKEAHGHSLYFYGRRRGYNAFAFRAHPYREGRVHYLYDDGVSTGHSRYENLWRALVLR